MMYNSLVIYDGIVDKSACVKRRYNIWNWYEYFDSTFYYHILNTFHDRVQRKFKLWRFLREDKIIHKLRLFINNFKITDDGKKNCYTYEFKYTVQGTISIQILDNNHTEYIIVIDKLNKHGPYTWY